MPGSRFRVCLLDASPKCVITVGQGGGYDGGVVPYPLEMGTKRSPEVDNTMIVKVVAGVACVIIVAIIIMRRRSKKA